MTPGGLDRHDHPFAGNRLPAEGRLPAGGCAPDIAIAQPGELGGQPGQISDEALVAVHPGRRGAASGDGDGNGLALPARHGGGYRLATGSACLTPGGSALRQLVRRRLADDRGGHALVGAVPTTWNDQRIRVVGAQVIQRRVGLPQVEQPYLTACITEGERRRRRPPTAHP